jgi:hypothetical protein
MNKLIKLIAFSISFLLLCTTASNAHTSQTSLLPASTELTKTGQDSIDWLSSCVNQSGRLDVLMLIDSSGSLQKTDPEDLRADIFATSVAKLHSLTKEAEIRIQVVAWAHEYEILEDWTSLNNFDSNELGSFIKSVRNGIADADDGLATDWNLAIKGAKDELTRQKNQNPKNCQSIFWFTDGGIMTPLRDASGNYIGDAPIGELNKLDLNSIGNLCGVDSTSNTSYQNPLIPSLKSLGVTFLGVLLKVNPDEVTQALMAYFPPLVEGKGVVDTTIFDGSGSQSLTCSTPVGENPAGGVSIEATSADALNQAIDSILCSLKKCVNANPLNVDSSVGFFEIEVSTQDQNYELVGPAGVVIRKGTPIEEWAQNVSVVSIPTGYFIRVIADERSIGLWKMKTSGGKDLNQPTDWSARVYSGLDVQVDKSTLSSSEKQEIRGKITQNNKANDLSAFKSGWKLTGTNKNKSVTEEIEVNSKGEFVWNISTSGNQDKANLDFELSGLVSKTNHAGSNPENYQYPAVNVSISMTIFGDSFPTLNPLNPEISLMGNEPISIFLETNMPKSGGSGEICLAESVNGLGNLSIDYSAQCYTPGDQITITFAGPTQNGNEMYLPIIPVSFKNSNGEIVELELEPRVFWSPPFNAGVFWFWFLVLSVLGIAGPLILLNVLNLQASRLHLKQLSRAQIPVLIAKSSDFISVQRLQEGSDSIDNKQGFTYEDYQPLRTNLNREKKFSSGTETLKGIAPKNPFGAITASATISTGNSIISNIPIGPKNIDGSLTAATVNPNRLLLLSIDNTNLNQILKPDKDFQGITKGYLISYSNLFMGDPNAVIEQTNQDLQVGNSWMSNLLSLQIPQSSLEPASEINNSGTNDGWEHSETNKTTSTSTTTDSEKSWGNSSGDWGSSGSNDWGNDSNNDTSGWR